MCLAGMQCSQQPCDKMQDACCSLLHLQAQAGCCYGSQHGHSKHGSAGCMHWTQLVPGSTCLLLLLLRLLQGLGTLLFSFSRNPEAHEGGSSATSEPSKTCTALDTC